MPQLFKSHHHSKFELYLTHAQTFLGLLDSSTITLKRNLKTNESLFNDFLSFLEQTSELDIELNYLNSMNAFLDHLKNKLDEHPFLAQNERFNPLVQKIEKIHLETTMLLLYEKLSGLLESNLSKFSTSFMSDWSKCHFSPITDVEALFQQLSTIVQDQSHLDLSSVKIILQQHHLKKYLKIPLGPITINFLEALNLFKNFYSTESIDKKIRLIVDKNQKGFPTFISLLRNYPEIVQPLATHFLLSLRRSKPMSLMGLSHIEKSFLNFLLVCSENNIKFNPSIEKNLNHLLSVIDSKFSTYIEDEKNLLQASMMHSPLLANYRNSLRDKSRKFIDRVNLSVDLRIRYYSEIEQLFDSSSKEVLYNQIRFLIKKEILGPGLDESLLYLEEWRNQIPSAASIYLKIHDLILSKKNHFNSSEKKLIELVDRKIFLDVSKLINENKFWHSRLQHQDLMSYSYVYNSIVKIHQNALNSFLKIDRDNVPLLIKSILSYNKSKQHFGKLKDPSFFSEEKISSLLRDFNSPLDINEMISQRILQRHEINHKNYYLFHNHSNFSLNSYLMTPSKNNAFREFSDILKKIITQQENNLLFRIQKINIKDKRNPLFKIQFLQRTKDYAQAIFLESRKMIQGINPLASTKIIDPDLPLSNLESLDLHTVSRLRDHHAIMLNDESQHELVQAESLKDFLKKRLIKLSKSKDNESKFSYYENQLLCIQEIINRLPEIKARYPSIQYINDFFLNFNLKKTRNEKTLFLEKLLNQESSKETIDLYQSFNTIILEKIANQLNENFDLLYSSLFPESISSIYSILTEKSTEIINNYFEEISNQSEDFINKRLLNDSYSRSTSSSILDRIIIRISHQVLSTILIDDQLTSLKEAIMGAKEISESSLATIDSISAQFKKPEILDLMSSSLSQSGLKDVFISLIPNEFMESSSNFEFSKMILETIYKNAHDLVLSQEDQVKIISFLMNKKDQWPLNIKSSLSLLSREASKEGFILKNNPHFHKVISEVFKESMSSLVNFSKSLKQAEGILAHSKKILIDNLPSFDLSIIPIPGSGLLDIGFSLIKIGQNLIYIQENLKKINDGKIGEVFYADEHIESIQNNIKYLLDNIDYEDEIINSFLKIGSRSLDELIKLTPVPIPLFKSLENLFEALSLKSNKEHRRELLESAYLEIESASRTLIQEVLISNSSIHPDLEKLKQTSKLLEIEEDVSKEESSSSSVDSEILCDYRLLEHAQITLGMEKIIWCLSEKLNPEEPFNYHLKKNKDDYSLMMSSKRPEQRSPALNLSESLQLGTTQHFVENLTIRHALGDLTCSFKDLLLQEDQSRHFRANFISNPESFSWIWNETVDHEPFEQDILSRFTKESIRHVGEYRDQQDMLRDMHEVSCFSCVNFFKEQHEALLKILLMPRCLIKNICLESIDNKTTALIVYEKIKKRIKEIEDYCLSNSLFLSMFIDYPVIQKICANYQQSLYESIDSISDEIEILDSFQEKKKKVFDKIMIQASKNNDDFLFYSLLFLNGNPQVKATSDLTALQLLNRKKSKSEETRKAINKLCSGDLLEEPKKEKNIFSNFIELIASPFNRVIDIFKSDESTASSIKETELAEPIFWDELKPISLQLKESSCDIEKPLELPYHSCLNHQDLISRR